MLGFFISCQCSCKSIHHEFALCTSVACISNAPLVLTDSSQRFTFIRLTCICWRGQSVQRFAAEYNYSTQFLKYNCTCTFDCVIKPCFSLPGKVQRLLRFPMLQAAKDTVFFYSVEFVWLTLNQVFLIETPASHRVSIEKICAEYCTRWADCEIHVPRASLFVILLTMSATDANLHKTLPHQGNRNTTCHWLADGILSNSLVSG